jgi:hypothetical protein
MTRLLIEVGAWYTHSTELTDLAKDLSLGLEDKPIRCKGRNAEIDGAKRKVYPR